MEIRNSPKKNWPNDFQRGIIRQNIGQLYNSVSYNTEIHKGLGVFQYENSYIFIA